MVVCPNCGSKALNRKLLVLTNFNAVSCPVCNARLKVKNKGVNSFIGGLGGGLGALIIMAFFGLWSYTGNLFYIAFLIPVYPLFMLSIWVVSIKYVKLELAPPRLSPDRLDR